MSKDTRDYIPHGGKHLMTANGGEGYEKLDDKIWPAPGSARTMCEIVDRQTGLEATDFDSVRRYANISTKTLAEHEWVKSEDYDSLLEAYRRGRRSASTASR